MADATAASAAMQAGNTLSTRMAVVACNRAIYTDQTANVIASPDGTQLATWCNGGIVLSEIASNRLQWEIEAGSEDVPDLFLPFAYDPTGQFLVAATKSRMLRIYDLVAQKQVAEWRSVQTMPVLGIAWAPLGIDAVATCSADTTIIVYSPKRPGVVTHKFTAHKTPVARLFWHPDPKRRLLVSCSERMADKGGEMCLWDLNAPKKVTVLASHFALVTAVAFTPDGNTLIAGSRDKTISVWSLANAEQPLRTLPVMEPIEGLQLLAARPSCATNVAKKGEVYFTIAGERGSLRTYALSHDRKTLDLACEKWLPMAKTAGDMSSRAVENAAKKFLAHQVAHLLLLPASERGSAEERLLAVTRECVFNIFSARTFERTKTSAGHNDDILEIKSLPDNVHALLATNSPQIQLLNLTTLESRFVLSHTDTVTSLAPSHDGRIFVSGSKDTTVRFWLLHPEHPTDDGAPASCFAIGSGHTDSVECVAMSQNKHTGKLLAASGSTLIDSNGKRGQGILKFWDVSAALRLWEAAGARGEPLAITAVETRVAHEKSINAIVFTPNDKYVLTASQDKTIRVWTADLKNPLAPIAKMTGHKRSVYGLACSPSDKVVVSASGDKTLKVWNLVDFTCILTLEGHTESVRSVVFLNLGQQLFSVGDDGLGKLWTIKTRECVDTMELHEGKVSTVAITPDGQTIVTGGEDSVINVLNDATQQDIAEREAAEDRAHLDQQQISNAIRAKNYKLAIELALKLDQPRRIQTLIQELMVAENEATAAGKVEVSSELPAIIRSLEDHEELLTKLILHIRDWNTHAKSSHVAQMLLAHIFRLLPPARLQSVRTLVQQVPTLTMYSERHYQRLDKLLTKSYIIDYMLNAMHAVEPDANAKTASTSMVIEEEKEHKMSNGADDNDVLRQLLSGVEPIGSAASTSVDALVRVAPVAAPTAAVPMDDDEEGGFSDDDGAAWATNWKDDADEEAADEHDEKQPAPAATPAQLATASKTNAKRKPAAPAPESAPAAKKAKATKGKHAK